MTPERAMGILARAVVATIISVFLVATIVAFVRGAQAEHDVIEAPLAAYMDDWTVASDSGTEYPDSIPTEDELAIIWQSLPSGTECERFAGLALGVVTLAGIYGETGTAAYLHSGAILYDLIEEAEYACLISI